MAKDVIVLAAQINAGAVRQSHVSRRLRTRPVGASATNRKMSSRRKRKERGLTREEKKMLQDHIVRLYCERYTCQEIADLTGLSYRYVRDSLMERGITPTRRVLRGSRVRVVVRAQ
jgi:hypothetical protein